MCVDREMKCSVRMHRSGGQNGFTEFAVEYKPSPSDSVLLVDLDLSVKIYCSGEQLPNGNHIKDVQSAKK